MSGTILIVQFEIPYNEGITIRGPRWPAFFWVTEC